ncbi:ABC transporter permease [Curtobacterium sp. MCJR17_043]|uniref:ABC transporter permease n=1 Tax=Curtobacterium sp. MCJR17_043 TaxID=2175660 RepID=UPI0024E008B2|nr:ABC transporter permease [Curtobacterium sp. MCJR17_043]WIB35673.1 ABC transporter permease [Curtobacterium sp. MCJR17_043]
MNRIALSGFRERWQTYVGAIVTVALGVGLVQASLLLLLSVLGMQPAAGADALTQARADGSRIVAVTVVSVTLGFAAFLAVFIIASTFAFSVTERRRDLALLRIVGAEVGQVRRMLRGEAVVLGLAGAVLGIPAGIALMAVETRMLVAAGFVPSGFSPSWQVWVVPASLAVGIGLASAGVAVAARRAARIDPLDAVRETCAAARPMTRSRWVGGLVLAVVTVALVVLAPVGGLAGAQAMAMSAGITGALAITMTAPVLVPLVAAVLPRPRSAVGSLAVAELRDARTRSASTAAPLVVLLALVLSQPIAMLSFTDAATAQIARGTDADLVLQTTGAFTADPASVPGVAAASTEWAVPVRVQPSGSAVPGMSEELAGDAARRHDGGPRGRSRGGSRRHTPVRVPRCRTSAVGPRPPAPVRPDSVSDEPGPWPSVTVPSGRSGSVSPYRPGAPGRSGSSSPRGLVPADVLADSPATTFVVLRQGADRDAVTAALARIGTVAETDAWAEDAGAAGLDQNTRVLLVVMAVGALYAVIGVLNAVAIATSGRRRAFAVARASGMTRGQVLAAATLETVLVAGSAVGLALVATAMTAAAVLAGTAQATGAAVLHVPWLLVVAASGGGLVLTGAAGLVAAAVATRQGPATLLAARG